MGCDMSVNMEMGRGCGRCCESKRVSCEL
jgi:hypothetical protein